MVMCSEQFAHDPTALDWSQDGKYIVYGDRNGQAVLLDAQTLQVLGTSNASNAGKTGKSKKDCYPWVEDIKISPNCSMIAFGTHGGPSKLELAKILEGGKLQQMPPFNTGITSALTHLDWSLDSSVVVVNSQAYELYWVNVSNPKKPQNVYASSAKGIDWATWSCTFGFPV